MHLTKFLRKHTRGLLMVFMSLLLVAFLIPQQIQGCGERRQAEAMKRGEAFGGRAVSQAVLSRTRSDLNFLQTNRMQLPVAPESALEYYLLTEEARQIGLRVGRDEVRELLRRGGLTDADLQRMQISSRLSYDQIYDIIGRLVAVTRLLEVQINGLYDSLPRQQLAYRNLVQEAVAQLSIIDGKAFVGQVGEPSEAELEAFFEEYKARATAHTEQELVYGYRLPDRVQVEYLTVDPKVVEQQIKVRGVQVRQFFDDNAHRYTKPDPAASQPVQGQRPQVPMTFEEAEELVRADVREAMAIETAQRLVNDMYHEAHQAWSSVPVGEDGFVPQPTGELVSFEGLKERFSTKFKVDYGRTELVDQSVLRREPGFGQAAVGDGQQRTMAADLALRVKGIIDKDPRDGHPVINLMEPAPVVLTRMADPRTRQPRSHQAYLFRVVEVAQNAPPDSIDEVRAQLVQDWKTYTACGLAAEQAEKLGARAREVGLAAAVAEATDLKALLTSAAQAATQPAGAPSQVPPYVKNLEPYTPQRLTRVARSVERLGFITSVQEAIFGLVDAPSDEPAAAHRVAVVPLANQFKWVIGELEDIKPIYAGEFEQQLAYGLQAAQRSDMQMFGMAWSDPERVQQRTSFKSAWEPTGPKQTEAP